jgi:O-antigen ligase
MMKNVAQMPQRWKTMIDRSSLSWLFSILVLLVALLLGVAIGTFNPVYGVTATGCLAFAIIVLLRLDELTVTLLIAIHLYIDFYLGLHLVGILMAIMLLFVYYFGRSTDHPWIGVRPVWLWIAFLVLTIYPAIEGGTRLFDLASFYPSDILGAFLMFWLGSIIAKDISALHRVFQLLSGLAALLAIHTIIQTATGVLLFASSRADALLAGVSNYQISGTNAFRSGSFFIDPNWNGTFLATMFFIPFGLFIESKLLLKKVVFLVEMFVILLALMFTYSNGAWLAVLGGMFFFIIFIGSTRSRVLLLVLVVALAAIALVFFSPQIAIQLQRAANPNDYSLREAAWKTAIRVIEAYPLFGVGLGFSTYLILANPYRVPAQYKPLSHPHDSYLEWGAMAGLPVLLVFILLLILAFWFAWRNWRLASLQLRPLLGGGIAAIASLSIGSISINGWTLPPLAAVGWLIVGIISSPLITRCLLAHTTPSADETTKTLSMRSNQSVPAKGDTS